MENCYSDVAVSDLKFWNAPLKFIFNVCARCISRPAFLVRVVPLIAGRRPPHRSSSFLSLSFSLSLSVSLFLFVCRFSFRKLPNGAKHKRYGYKFLPSNNDTSLSLRTLITIHLRFIKADFYRSFETSPPFASRGCLRFSGNSF